uniref:UPF3 domain-containing protein n=1 Tax=Timema tahoe TaxID=61484 RepID=A0A7R9FK72_9NEOP|nr:unnamed protein product [Timema tahoe]
MTQIIPVKENEDSKKIDTTEFDKIKDKKERAKPPTKVVIRRLPPTLTQETFLKELHPLPEHDYLYFVRADRSLGQFAFSRAYINFLDQEDVFRFKERFDNYAFLDKKGNEYLAVVEFAPFQRLPKKRLGRKKDPKAGTIEQDPAYTSFLESYLNKNSESTNPISTLEYFPPVESKKVTTTPLLEFLKQRYAEKQRIRDERKEERRRKDQERRRLKDDERRRRKGDLPIKEGDVIPKPLQSAEIEKDKFRKREEERQKFRDKDKKPIDNLFRPRDTKTREGIGRGYHDSRQKALDSRLQSRSTRLSEDQRRKVSFDERVQNQNKMSDTRKSQEFIHFKDQDQKKNISGLKELDLKRHERHYGFVKDSPRPSRITEYKKSYNKEMDGRHFEKGYIRSERKGNYNSELKQSSGFDQESRSFSNAYKGSSFKKPDSDEKLTNRDKNFRTEYNEKDRKNDYDEKRWERLGAKPKNKDSAILNEKTDKPTVDIISNESKFFGKEKYIGDLKENESLHSGEDGPINDFSEKKISETHTLREKNNIINTEHVLYQGEGNKLESKDSAETMQTDKAYQFQSMIEKEKSSCEFEQGRKLTSRRRASLDSGDHEQSVDGGKSLEKTHTSSDWSLGAALRRNHSLDLEVGAGDACKGEETEHRGEGVEDKDKKDPRVERRIRNKDRPAMQIYRPGMGRFSMLRKEREKGGQEPDSPSPSPSPTPGAAMKSMTFKRSVSREK